MQQRILKVVGRRPLGSNPLRQLEQLNAFVHKFTKDEFPSGELFPIRKAVGQTRSGRD
jgi:hypothetical protein